MEGKIVKGIAGFYYVNVEGMGLFECKAKGGFRNRRVKPLPGDDVVLEVLDSEAMLGNITQIMERRTELIRPAVANADQAVIVFACKEPAPSYNLLDRFLVLMQKQNMKTVICFNKLDQIDGTQAARFKQIYCGSGCDITFVSAKTGEGIGQLKEVMNGKVTVFAGPSGVGKSSLLNALFPEAEMETGSISEKIKRGRHTTRHSELFYMGEHTYLFDTPGFSTLYLDDVKKEKLRDFYPEFERYYGKCKYLSCVHDREPECAVKDAVEKGDISSERYENYRLLLHELQQQKKY